MVFISKADKKHHCTVSLLDRIFVLKTTKNALDNYISPYQLADLFFDEMDTKK